MLSRDQDKRDSTEGARLHVSLMTYVWDRGNLIWQVYADMIASYMKSLSNEVPTCVIKLFTIKRKGS